MLKFILKKHEGVKTEDNAGLPDERKKKFVVMLKFSITLKHKYHFLNLPLLNHSSAAQQQKWLDLEK